jgi:hypothetical protein
MSSTTRNGDATVTRSDIEAKLAEIRGVAERPADLAPDAGRFAMIAAGAGAVVLAFLLGRRRGRKKSTIVEVHRF